MSGEVVRCKYVTICPSMTKVYDVKICDEVATHTDPCDFDAPVCWRHACRHSKKMKEDGKAPDKGG